MYFTEHAMRAAAEVVDACRNPPSLIDHLARLVSRKQRPGVISGGWSFRNQLIVLLRGHSEARGYKPWAGVGRKVRKREKAFYIMAPLLVLKKDDSKAGAKRSGRRPKSAGGGPTPEAEKVLIGYKAVPVFGLEQTEPDEMWLEEPQYHPFGEAEGTVRVAVRTAPELDDAGHVVFRPRQHAVPQLDVKPRRHPTLPPECGEGVGVAEPAGPAFGVENGQPRPAPHGLPLFLNKGCSKIWRRGAVQFRRAGAGCYERAGLAGHA